MMSYLGAWAVTHDTPHPQDRKTMIASKESESTNHKDGESLADEKTLGPQPVLENEFMICTDASKENESLEHKVIEDAVDGDSAESPPAMEIEGLLAVDQPTISSPSPWS
jgi:hypothetical protein